ncbi:hypothetical protein NLG97_g9890 [Lecanicillium saksenae]|uniref:Uncharacterized protein n=1 Tax=Lecanicillium saksenae TaxID=468837 RepID=A0ACC1QHG8_9HYPO|nr:hypothetical protein NLG97_g9890 [Lecanicillium saksenae]
MKYHAAVIFGSLAACVAAMPTPAEQSEQAGSAPNPFDAFGALVHVIDEIVDTPLRLIPGVDCFIPDPNYDGLPGSKGEDQKAACGKKFGP